MRISAKFGTRMKLNFSCTIRVFLLYINLIFLILFNQVRTDDLPNIVDEDSEPYKPMPESIINPNEKEIDFWRSKGISILKEKLDQKLNKKKAKNIIFLMGDGMSLSTITAARIYQGQLKTQNGEENKLFFETFPFSGLSKTYCVDKQVPDSASTSTAYLRGVKANFNTIGVSANVRVNDCEAAKDPGNRPTSILKWAQDAGKATGIVTTTRITDASPAGAYAHVCYRLLECDSDIIANKFDPIKCDSDIAKQLIFDDPGRNTKVLLGGGRDKFLSKIDQGHGTGKRMDKDLIAEWKKDKKGRQANGSYVTNAREFDKINPEQTDFLLGLFADSHMNDHLDGLADQPTLPQMTEKAIKILQKEKNGFFLFVEGGKIDHHHHNNKARKALDETIELDKAVEIAAKLTNEEDTLIVVTADHSHVMTFNGYPSRGYDILGIYGKSEYNQPYSTLSYANGPGYRQELLSGVQHDLTNDNMADPNYKYPAMVSKHRESHGGDDVVVFARGPWAHLFTGSFEQNFIPIAEAYAAGIPLPPSLPKTKNKNDGESTNDSFPPLPNEPNSSSKYVVNGFVIIICGAILFLKMVVV